MLLLVITPSIPGKLLSFLYLFLPFGEAWEAWASTLEGSFQAQMTSSQSTEPETPLGNDLELGSYTALRLVCVMI